MPDATPAGNGKSPRHPGTECGSARPDAYPAAVIDTLLLVALPASGKSELRRYLESLSDDERSEAFGLGPLVQLDDFPYVHFMRRVSQELRCLGGPPRFFDGDDRPFRDPDDWGTLTLLLDEDFRNLGQEPPHAVHPARLLFERIDRARRNLGIDPAFATLDADLVERLARAVAADAADVIGGLPRQVPEGRTVVVEFARGGPDGATPPLRPPYGYGYALSLFSDRLLETARALYVWVTPEESRRRNRERTRPGEEGSILFHGVPDEVMRADYGTDDFLWLLEHSDLPGTVPVEHPGHRHHLRAAVFDNREDHTSFLREDPERWPEDALAALRRELEEVFAGIRH